MRIAVKHFSIFFLPILFCCIQLANVSAQSSQGEPLIDSLMKELPKSKDDTTKIKTLYHLATAIAPNDSTMSLNYANQCNHLAKQIKWTKGIGLSYLAYATAYYEISNFSSSIENSERAYEVFKNLHDEQSMAVSLQRIGSTYEQLGYFDKALENDFEALKLFENINYKDGISGIYNNMGNIYYHTLEYDKAVDNYKKSLIACKESGDKYGIASALDNMASVFQDENKFDSANTYNLQAIKLFEEINNQAAMGRIYSNRGNLLIKQNNERDAYVFYNRAVEIDKRLGINRELSIDYDCIAALYYNIGEDSLKQCTIPPGMQAGNKSMLNKSESYILKALALGKQVGDIHLLMSYYSDAAEIERVMGNYKAAFTYHTDYTLYKDSIFNDENKKKIAAMETQRLTEVKDKEIQLLNQQKALETSEVKRQTLIRNIIIGSVLLLALLSFIFIRAYNRRKKSAFEKQVLEVETKALRSQMNPHFIFNSLHSINRYVVENDKENASAYLSKFANLMRLILENSREQEVPLEKDLSALELYMQLESLRFKNKFNYSIETSADIDKENTLIPPMLLQPFVENAIIHGMKSKENGMIKINVQKEDDMIRCVVEDNGTGREITVEQNEINKRKSLGLKIITERLNIINQLKKVKAAVNIFDLKDIHNKPSGLRIELLLPFQPAF